MPMRAACAAAVVLAHAVTCVRAEVVDAAVVSGGACYAVLGDGHLQIRQGALREEACVRALPTEGLKGLDETALRGIPAALVPLLRDTHLSFLGKEACADLPATFVEGLAGAQCAGLVRACLTAVPPLAFKSLSASCVEHLSADAVRSLSGDQMASIPDVVAGSITAEHLSVLTDSQCSALTQGQVQHINSACAGLSRTCLFAWSALQLSAIEKGCWARIRPTVLSGFGLERMRAVRDDSFPAATTPQQMSVLTEECAAVTGEQGEALRSGLCGAMSISCGTALSLHGALNLSPECVLALPPTTLAAMSPAALALLPGDAFCRVSTGALRMLSPASCAGLSKNQVAKLPHPTCLALSPQCLRALSPEARPLLMQGCDPEHDAPGAAGRPHAPTLSAPCDHQNWDQRREAAKARADKQAETDKKAMQLEHQRVHAAKAAPLSNSSTAVLLARPASAREGPPVNALLLCVIVVAVVATAARRRRVGGVCGSGPYEEL